MPISCPKSPVEAYVAFDGFGGVFVMSDVMQAIDDEARQIRTRIEGDLRGEDVAWDYAEFAGNVRNRIIAHAALSDLIITGRDAHKAQFPGSSLGTLGDCARYERLVILRRGRQRTRPAPRSSHGRKYEAANAVRASLGVEDVMACESSRWGRKDEAFPARN